MPPPVPPRRSFDQHDGRTATVRPPKQASNTSSTALRTPENWAPPETFPTPRRFHGASSSRSLQSVAKARQQPQPLHGMVLPRRALSEQACAVAYVAQRHASRRVAVIRLCRIGQSEVDRSLINTTPPQSPHLRQGPLARKNPTPLQPRAATIHAGHPPILCLAGSPRNAHPPPCRHDVSAGIASTPVGLP